MIRLKKFKVVSFILTVVLFFNMTLFFNGMSFAADVNLLIEKLVSTDQVDVGDVFTYTIKYSHPDTTTHANDVVLTDLLPDGVSYVSSDITQHIESVEVTDVGGRDQVQFIFKDPLPAGDTGILKISAKFDSGVTADDTIRTNQAIIAPSNGPAVSSNVVSVTAKTKPDTWSVSKNRTIPYSMEPALDQPVTYEIIIRGNSVIGGINLKDVTAVDDLPNGSTYISSDGNYDESSHTITWDIGNLNVGSTIKKQVTVMYETRTSGGFTTSSNVENEVEVTGTPLYSSESQTKYDSVEHGFITKTAQVGNLIKTSRQSDDEYSSGQTAQFYIGNIKNSGNIPLSNFYIIDTLPNSIDLERITSGKYNQSGLLDIYYKSNKKDWTLWQDDISRSSSTTLNTIDLGFGASEYITHVKWDFGTVESGFSNTSNINVSGEILDVVRTDGGIAVRTHSSITNEADLFATDNDSNTLSDHAEVTIEVVDPEPWLDPSKSRLGKSAYYDEERVSFKLTLKNHNYATGDLEDPSFIDILPQELEDIQIESCSVSPAPTVSIYKKTIDGVERDLFKWTFTGKTLEPGESIDVTYSGKIKDGTLVGHVENVMYMTITDEFKANSKENDVLDIDNDPNTDALVQSDASFFVKFVGTLSSDKWVNGELDSAWSKYPAEGKTLPGGIADYQLKVKNTDSNGPIGNIVVIDVLPYIDDTGLLDTKARDSQWRPYLVNEIEIVSLPDITKLDQITVYYSTSDTPDLSQLYNPLNKNNSGWSETPPENITTVKSLKFDFGNIELNVNEEIVLEWPMRAPAGAPVNEPAWNSFGYGATYEDENGPEPFLPSEPIKVGYYIQPDPSSTVNLGDYVWEDMNKNGIQDVGEPGINGVMVELLDESNNPIDGKYTRTGDDQDGNPGYYLFPNLSAGKYKVKFTVPDGYEITLQNQGGDDTLDSDIIAAGGDAGITDVIDLDGVNDNFDADAGLYRVGSIGDLVWNDKDADGIKDSDEPGLEGIRVNLYDGSDILLDHRTTSAIGHYEFTGLDPGQYRIEVISNGQYKISPAYSGSNTSRDSNIDADGKSELITLTSAEDNPTIDAGMYLGSIGDFVWHDMDADGLQESESGIKNITVNLYKDGIQTESTTTNNSGYYLFDDLFPASYIVEFIKNGYDKYSPQNTGSNDMVDSDGYTTGVDIGKSDAYALEAGERITTVDQGLYNLASLGDLVWNDINHNGEQDSGEPGVQNITVRLYDSSDTFIKTVTTDANGLYQFTDLEPGSYYVQFDIPTDYVATKQNQVNDNDDSDIDTSGKTHTITLRSGDDITNMDAGIHRAILGNYVWEDLDADGIQDDGNTGINNVTVNLCDKDKNVISTTKTARVNGKDGYYEFVDLAPDDYIVQFVTPGGYFTVDKDQGSDDAIDSDYDTGGYTGIINLTAGEVDDTIDAGYYRTASLGNYVWNDLDYDGIQDPGEPGVSGVDVVLKQGSTEVDTKTTDANGEYLFTGLKPGNYHVEFTTPTDFAGFTKTDIGMDTLDSDANGSGVTSEITLISNEENLTRDAGLYQYASVGNFVWHDEDVDGIQDSGESGISGVSVRLYKGTDSDPLKSATTDANGYYEFTDLIPGSYLVEVITPGDYKLTSVDVGSDDTVDSDINSSNSRTAPFYLQSGENNLTLDAGYYQLSQIGDYVWLDEDGDGIQDDDEKGIEGIEVQLLDADDSDKKLATVTTNADGYYLFDDLDLGNYKIKVIVPTEPIAYVVTKQNILDDAKDSDIDSATKESHVVSINASNVSDLSLDAGLYITAAIGDYVWEDVNGNGIQDSGEPAIEGVDVTLITSGTPLTTKTAANGFYQFIDLDPGTYRVQFDAPTGYTLTTKTSGSDDTVDSNPNTGTLITDEITLKSDEVILTIDAGFYRPVELGNYVWLDKNRNGIQDSDEDGISGVTVTLKQGATVIDTTATDADGAYLFSNLKPGEYQLEFTKPDKFDKFTIPNSGSDDEKDSDVNASGIIDNIVLESGDSNMSFDAGLYSYGSLGNYVWHDEDVDGIQDDGETGMADVTVTLYEKVGADYVEAASTKTDADGYYLFDTLNPNDYQVKIEVPNGYMLSDANEGSNEEKDSNFDPSDSSSETFFIESGEHDLTIDAGLYQLSQLGNYIWLDKNADGIQDDDEAGIENVTVQLLDADASDTILATVSTNAEGFYLFDLLEVGNYKIKVVPPEESFVATKKNTTDNAKDSDINLEYETDSITIATSNVSDLTLDAGLYQKATIGDYVWEDMNSDGIQDITEPGIQGITVTLILSDDSSEVKVTTTDENGYYEFTDLDPGTYKVHFDMPSDYVLSPRKTGTDDTVDSNPDPETLLTDDITLVSNDVVSTIDAGFYRLVRIGNYVWLDKNKDGIQDDSEEGVSDIKVNLVLSDDTTLETLTDENGFYEFNDLRPGDYTVVFTAPQNHKFTKPLVGEDRNVDSNPDTKTGMSEKITLLSNEEDLTIDAGIYKLPDDKPLYGSIGDYVWYDTNYNGIQDPDEEGVSGVKVSITDPNGIKKSTLTDNDGKYLFTDLEVGSYTLKFEKPDGYAFTNSNAGDDDEDSDVSTSGKVHGIFLDREEHNMDVDAGLVGTSELGDYAFVDKNDNHLQDDDDEPFEGLDIKLYNGDDLLVGETTTDGDGYYKFENLFPGDYYIVVEEPGDYSFVTANAGDDAIDSDIGSNGKSDTVTLDINDSNLTLDIGLKAPDPVVVVIPDVDDDDDVDIIIKDPDGNVIKEGTTDGDGNIDLTDLPKNTPLTITITKDGVVIDEMIIEIPDEEVPLSNVNLKNISVMPRTGTHDYNFLLFGFIVLAVGIYFMVIHHKKKRS